jgi:hypothetical protein
MTIARNRVNGSFRGDLRRQARILDDFCNIAGEGRASRASFFPLERRGRVDLACIVVQGGRMRRTFRLLTLSAAVAVASSGCALQDTRYDYSRNGLPFADFDESILDWNFPTPTSQGPLLPPERLRPTRPAIGVPWANGNPMPWSNQTPISDSVNAPSTGSHDSTSCEGECAAAAQASDTGPTADLRGARLDGSGQPSGKL